MRKQYTSGESDAIRARCRSVIENSKSRVAQACLRMVDQWQSGQITSDELSQIIEATYQPVAAQIEAHLHADVRNVFSPWPSESIESLMAVRLGQYALSAQDSRWAQHELQQMAHLLDEHSKALELERRIEEEAARKKTTPYLLFFALAAMFVMPGMRKSADPTQRDLAEELMTILQATMAGIEGQSNKALDLLPAIKPESPEDPTLALFAQWEAEDSTDDPEELARRQRDGDELMASLRQNRLNLEGRTDFQDRLGGKTKGEAA